MKKLLGRFLLASPFIALLVFAAFSGKLIPLAIAVIVTILVCLVTVIGINLIGDN